MSIYNNGPPRFQMLCNTSGCKQTFIAQGDTQHSHTGTRTEALRNGWFSIVINGRTFDVCPEHRLKVVYDSRLS